MICTWYLAKIPVIFQNCLKFHSPNGSFNTFEISLVVFIQISLLIVIIIIIIIVIFTLILMMNCNGSISKLVKSSFFHLYFSSTTWRKADTAIISTHWPYSHKRRIIRLKRVIHLIIRVRQIVRLIWKWNGLNFRWTIHLTLSIGSSVNFDGLWRWIIRYCENSRYEISWQRPPSP